MQEAFQPALRVLLVLFLDAVLILVLVGLLSPLLIYRKAAWAVLKRNFISYFTTPTGYVFWILFVLLSSFAAFWPHDFFASNMATLDQLNFWVPLILLLFVPAITMSIWAEERRQGTDELLLTIPASDIDIILGKYLAAASIFTASLLFSQAANFAVLDVLAAGQTDLGLYYSTYLGYWFMGMAMLAVGMVASFLTNNLTVGFILGAVFNAPLALANHADVIIANASAAMAISGMGMWSNFQDFGRGVISISSLTYFTVIVCIGIYLSVVLIGRRHWLGGKDGHSLLGHYLARSISLVVIGAGMVVLTANYDFIRRDITSAGINSLTPKTYELLDELEVTRPVRIEAYVSKSLPENYVRTKYDLINLLKELQARGGDDIKVAINDQMEPFSPEADQARKRYDITPVPVQNEAYGTISTEDVFLAAAITSGPERVVINFFGPGTPIEYEIVNGIMTVANTKQASEESEEEGENTDEETDEDEAQKKRESPRKVIGIMRTDAQITGGFNTQNFQQIPPQQIVNELRKQYDVEDVSPGPVDKNEIDALIVVQPSSLTPDQLPHVMDAIRAGIPTALFEDPVPYWFQGRGSRNAFVPGTDQPKRPVGGMGGMFGGRQPQPKCDIQKLWDLLGVYMVKAKRPEVSQNPDDIEHDYKNDSHKTKVTWEPFTPVIWQRYNPYPKVPEMPPYGVFASPNAPGAENAFNADDPIVSGMHEVLFMTPGAFEEAEEKSDEAQGLKFTPLITTGDESGIQYHSQISSPGLKEIKRQKDVESTEEMIDLKIVSVPIFEPRKETSKNYVLAARITGKLNSEPADEEESGEDTEAEEEKEEEKKSSKSSDKPEINVVLVADMDMWESLFVGLRNQPDSYVNYQFQNVVFLQNIVDDLVGEDRFISIRKHTPRHAPLRLIEMASQAAEREAEVREEEAKEKMTDSIVEFQNRQFEIVQDLGQEIQEAQNKEGIDSAEFTRLIAEMEGKLEMQQKRNADRLEEKSEQNRTRLEAEIRRIERETAIKKRSTQNYFKAMAVLLPPIPPLIIAGAVFLARRLRESQGISQQRRR